MLTKLTHSQKFHAISLSCLPVLIWQGRQVRANTLRLPPPDGNRRGVLGDGEPLHILVLGDSAAEGVGTVVQDDALLGHLLRQLTQQQSLQHASRQIHYQLIANTGDTTAEIISRLQMYIDSGRCLTSVDKVVVSAGVNDVSSFTAVKTWQAQIEQLIELLQHKLDAKHIIMTAVPPMQHFPALPSPLNHWLGLRAAMLNDSLQAICKRADRSDAPVNFLRLALDFNPVYMAIDGFHPSAQTYAKWAEAVLAL